MCAHLREQSASELQPDATAAVPRRSRPVRRIRRSATMRASFANGSRRTDPPPGRPSTDRSGTCKIRKMANAARAPKSGPRRTRTEKRRSYPSSVGPVAVNPCLIARVRSLTNQKLVLSPAINQVLQNLHVRLMRVDNSDLALLATPIPPLPRGAHQQQSRSNSWWRPLVAALGLWRLLLTLQQQPPQSRSTSGKGKGASRELLV